MSLLKTFSKQFLWIICQEKKKDLTKIINKNNKICKAIKTTNNWH